MFVESLQAHYYLSYVYGLSNLSIRIIKFGVVGSIQFIVILSNPILGCFYVNTISVHAPGNWTIIIFILVIY